MQGVIYPKKNVLPVPLPQLYLLLGLFGLRGKCGCGYERELLLDFMQERQRKLNA
jgi:hypothetical protein